MKRTDGKADGHGRMYAVGVTVVGLLIAALAIFGIGRLIFSLLPVGEVTVTGLTRYPEDDVVSFTGLSQAKKRRQVARDEIATALLARYPYFEAVEVRYGFFTGTTLEITETRPVAYLPLGGEYYALDGELKVLERALSPDRFLEAGVQKLTLYGVRSALVGQVLDYGDDYLTGFLQEVADSPLRGRLDEIVIEDKYHVTAVCDGKYRLRLGNVHDVATKLTVAALMLSDDTLLPELSATLDVSNPQKTSIRYDRVVGMYP